MVLSCEVLPLSGVIAADVINMCLISLKEAVAARCRKNCVPSAPTILHQNDSSTTLAKMMSIKATRLRRTSVDHVLARHSAHI